MTPRKQPTLTDKLAATLLALGDIPHSDAKLMTSFQVVSLYQFDHYPIRHEDGGPTTGWNLTPRLISVHRKKTAEIDIPAIAKGKRIRKREEQHKARMSIEDHFAAAVEDIVEDSRKPTKRRILSRPFPKGQRPMRRRA